jgi:hypothetical protein
VVRLVGRKQLSDALVQFRPGGLGLGARGGSETINSSQQLAFMSRI